MKTWQICEQNENKQIIIAESQLPYYSICAVNDYPNGEANARLIAAAPAMLEALERVIKWHESGCDISRKTLLNIEALIAKVKND